MHNTDSIFFMKVLHCVVKRCTHHIFLGVMQYMYLGLAHDESPTEIDGIPADLSFIHAILYGVAGIPGDPQAGSL